MANPKIIFGIKFNLLFLLLFSFPSLQAQSPYNYSFNKLESNLMAAVVCAHPLASEVGANILLQGGNAFDAAIATQLALAVVYPRAGNLGGGGFMLAHLKDNISFAIDFRETAPGAAFANVYVDTLTGKADTNLSLHGPSSAGVPGTVAGIFKMMPYAKLSFDSLIAPAIRLAKYGFCISALEARKLNDHQEVFKKDNKEAILFVKKEGWKEGDTLRQDDLAKTLIRIKEDGQDGFYKGETAKLILEEMKRGGGFISAFDLANYTVRMRDPMKFKYRDYNLVMMPLPSSGGMINQQVLTMLQILEKKYGKAKTPIAFYQRFIEAERRAFSDRSFYLGDPDYTDAPVDSLLSMNYLRSRIADFDPDRASISADIQPGIFESDETTHLNILDAEGNAISITTTLNGNYGSKTLVKGAGFFLNNEMDDFSIQPGVPNQFGAIGAAANAIGPNKRMLSSMSPLIVLKNDKVFALMGAPGGTTIPTSVNLTFLRLVDLNFTPQEAVAAPRLHHQWLPDVLYLENGFSKQEADELQLMGHNTKFRGAFGSIELIVLDKNGSYTAVGDPRGDDSVKGISREKD